MSNYTTLLGAENVERAGRAMCHAAEEMIRAAEQIEDSLQRFGQRMEEWVGRLEAISNADGRS